MSSMPSQSLARAAALAVAVLATATGPALARGGPGPGGGDRPEVRVGGTCSKGATSTLKLKARDGAIESEFELHARRGTSWRITLTHERQVAWRGSRRTTGASRSFSVENRLADLSGADAVTARAIGPRGMTCSASATLPG